MKAPIFLAAGAGLSVLALAMRPAAVEAPGGSSPAPSPGLTSQCASCHALTRPGDTTVEHPWDPTRPDLWYARDKFNRGWTGGWGPKPNHNPSGRLLVLQTRKSGGRSEA